jgi:hypothetical protein
MLVAAAIASLGALGMSVLPAQAISGPHVAGAPFLTQSALQTAISKGLALHTLPSNLNPTLSQVGSNSYAYQGSSYQHTWCNPFGTLSQASHPTPCWYGSKVATAPIIAIFGDSYVGNWMPALNVFGVKQGFRVAGFEFAGCNAPLVTSTPFAGFDAAHAAACNLWHKTLPPVVAKMKPRAIIAANGLPDWGATRDKVWLSGLKLIFAKMNPNKTSVQILMGDGPRLGVSAPACLAAYSSSVSSCNFHYGATSNYQLALNRDAAAITQVGLHLIPTFQWICLNRACPMVVTNTLTFADSDHLTTAYSLQLQVLFQARLKPLVVK